MVSVSVILLVAIGVRFSDRVTGNASKFAHHAKILQIDIDPAEINKNIMVDASIIGDVKEVLSRLNSRIKPMEHTEWLAHIKEYAEKYPLTYPKEGLSGPYLIEYDLPEDKRRSSDRYRSRTASDVGSTVL